MLEFDVSLLQIQVFLAVAEQHSFSKAAEQVNLEQSTVSRRIGVLAVSYTHLRAHET